MVAADISIAPNIAASITITAAGPHAVAAPDGSDRANAGTKPARMVATAATAAMPSAAVSATATASTRECIGRRNRQDRDDKGHKRELAAHGFPPNVFVAQ